MAVNLHSPRYYDPGNPWHADACGGDAFDDDDVDKFWQEKLILCWNVFSSLETSLQYMSCQQDRFLQDLEVPWGLVDP